MGGEHLMATWMIPLDNILLLSFVCFMYDDCSDSRFYILHMYTKS